MYVDESGDCGLINSPTRYFILTGLVIHELRWQSYLNEIINFRRVIKQKYGFKLRDEFHAAALISNPNKISKGLLNIKRHNRLAMIRQFAEMLSTLTDINIINILVDKQTKEKDYDVFGMAWKTLIQRFENTMSKRNFPGPANPDERGLILPDNTDNKKQEEIMLLLRKMRSYNPIPHSADYAAGFRNMPLNYIIEDPFFKNSLHSYFVQAVDLVAFLFYQFLEPNYYMRKKSGKNYFSKLKPIYCTVASKVNVDGIVKL